LVGRRADRHPPDEPNTSLDLTRKVRADRADARTEVAASELRFQPITLA
jgi:hypothetical protein